MKKIKFIYGLMAAVALVFASCNVNDLPEFDDKDAFVAFTSPTVSATETDGTLEVSVMLTSLSGISGSVDFEIVTPENGGAVEGKHYTIEGPKTLQFTGKEGATQKIKFNVIDNDVFGGDVKMTINLVNPQGAILGAVKSCTVTIEDDEHPLAFILGSFNAQGEDYYGSWAVEEWATTIEKDADDLNRVWIYGFTPAGFPDAIYGIVNDEKTEIRIPVNQTIGSNSSYDVVLEAYTNNGDEDITDFVVGTISEDGTITITPTTWIAAAAYNKGTTTLAGYYAIDRAVVFKKK